MENVIEDQPAFKAKLMSFEESNPSEIAKECFESAHELINRVENGYSLNPELDLRAALKKYLNVFWFLKNERVAISQRMHDIGRYLARNYLCEFGFKDGHYYTECPNLLLHQDYGFSLRGFEKYKCSICSIDPIDCDHRTGRRYQDIECKAFDKRCNVCLDNIEICNHSLGELYNDVEAIKVVSDLEIITFDLVKEPEFVFSRVIEIPYSKKFILDGLANDSNLGDFVYGRTVVDCNHCLTCKGYDQKASEKLFENAYNKTLKSDSQHLTTFSSIL